MSTIHGVTELRANAVPARRVSKFLKALLGAVQERRKRNKLRTALYDLSDTELMDIGTTRGEIDYVASKRDVDPRGIASAEWGRYLPTVDGQIHPYSDKGL